MKSCFPEILALVNPISCTAFVMGFLREEKFFSRVEIGSGNGKESPHLNFYSDPRDWTPRWSHIQNVLSIKTCSEPCESILVIRPYVIALNGRAKIQGRIWLSIDGELLIDDDSLKKYLELAKLRRLWSMKKAPPPIQPRHEGCLYFACPLNKENQASPKLGILGMMLPRDSLIWMDIGWLDSMKGMKLEVGLIAATYTTKAPEGKKSLERKISRYSVV